MNEEERSKRPTGPISVDGDITPISHEKVESIEAHRWEEMTLAELFHQRSILQERLNATALMGNLPMHEQLQKGMVRINNIISQRDDEEAKLI